ncbi:hypothetical protein BDY24DRAFT_418683 [Mrakia frigida]|uniref:uncharacterized protein n=1 Tax=Mrakia frigida TaxID=29902 RepID=UPI003FCC256F
MCRNQKVANILVAEAELSDMKYKHAAAIVQGGKIISVGHNQTRTFFQARPHHSMHAEMSAISRAHSSYSSNKRSSFGRGMSYKSGPPLNLHIPGASSLTISLANTNSSNPSTAGAQPFLKGPPPSSNSSSSSSSFAQQPAFLLNRTKITNGQQDRSSLAGGPQYWVSPGTASTRRATSRRSRSRGAAAAAAETSSFVVVEERRLSQVVELAEQEVVVSGNNLSSFPRNSNGSAGNGSCDGGAAERDALAYKSMQFKLCGSSRDLGSGSKAMWGADLYVCRVKKDGGLASSKVCFRCLEWCIEAGIRRVFYTDEEEDGSIQWYQQSTLSLYEEVELSLEHATRAVSASASSCSSSHSHSTSCSSSNKHSSSSKSSRSGKGGKDQHHQGGSGGGKGKVKG